MRIGQILVEAELVSPKQLSDGLEYGTAKGIFLGKAMKLLKFLEDDQIELALQTQQIIRRGLSPVLAIEALKKAVNEKLTLQQALQARIKEGATLKVNQNQVQDIAPVPVIDADSPDKLIENGDLLLIEDQCGQAESQYLKALLALEKTLGPGHLELCSVLIRLGNTLLATGRFEQAQEFYQRVLNIRLESLPPDHPQLANSYESFADLHKAQGDDAKSLEYFLKALDTLEKHLPQQLGAYASILRKVTAASVQAPPARPQPIGELLKMAGLLSDGELNTALRMSKQTEQPLGIVLRENCMVGDQEFQSALKAQFCVRQGVLSEQLAVDLLSRAARRGISLERLLHEAGVLMSDESKYETYREIAAELDRLVAAETSAVASQQELAPIAFKLGTLYEQVGDQPQAEIYYSRALKIWGSEIRGDMNAATTCRALARIYQAQNRYADAAPLLNKALEHHQHALGTNHEDTINTLEDLAEAEVALRQGKKAFAHAQIAVLTREELGHDGTKLWRAVVLSGDALADLKNYEAAQNAYKKAMGLAQTGYGGPSAALAAVMEKLGDLYERQELVKAATAQYKSALMILEAAGKIESQNAKNLQAKMSKLTKA
ncbi:MAG: tetratricopeptide repeat protein [Candidatus Obscuribacterales bacterium]|nr:tetratricopeptide repeat protein [Candidatus Obscuribacterales bacterium]